MVSIHWRVGFGQVVPIDGLCPELEARPAWSHVLSIHRWLKWPEGPGIFALLPE